MPQQLEANKLYTDTIHLAPGKYSLSPHWYRWRWTEFWAEPQKRRWQSAYIWYEGQSYSCFESDCGNGEMFSFKAAPDFITDTTTLKQAFSLHPPISRRHYHIEVVSNRKANLVVQITVDGVIWQKHEYKDIKNATFRYDLKPHAGGQNCTWSIYGWQEPLQKAGSIRAKEDSFWVRQEIQVIEITDLPTVIFRKPVLWASQNSTQSRDKERVFNALSKLFDHILSDRGKGICYFILKRKNNHFSDQHKGRRDGADDFVNAEKNYLEALNYYYKNHFIL